MSRPAAVVYEKRRGLEIRVMGPLEVRIDGRPLVVDTRKALAVLALLAVDDRPYARDELAALLWPESDDLSARGALRRTLSVLRAALGGRWLQVDRTLVSLERRNVWLDLAVLEGVSEAHGVRLELLSYPAPGGASQEVTGRAASVGQRRSSDMEPIRSLGIV